MLRASAAFVILTLAGLNGLLAGAAETCTMNAPDSLMLFPVTLVRNLAGMGLLCWRPHRIATLAAAVLPALLALNYSATAVLLALGWSAAAAIFWIGLAYALVGGYRPEHDADPR